MSGWESTFTSWTGPASDAEQDRYDWTRDQINQALSAYSPLEKWRFKVYPKGSYPNNTNVVRDSDVDVAVELTSFYKYEFIHEADGLSLPDVGERYYEGPDYSLAAFKNDVEAALCAHFGSGPVERGDKSIHIRQSSSGLKADVVPCVTHYSFYSRRGQRHKGIKLLSDKNPNKELHNYPEQHLDRGIAKNNNTSRRYKKTVRIVKRLENEMARQGVYDEVCSFLLESAIYNVPAAVFSRSSWTSIVQGALVHIYEGTEGQGCLGSPAWMEANDVKYLFFQGQNWQPSEIRDFTHAAWNYCGF